MSKAEKKPKGTLGGVRPGAGRPPTDSEPIFANIQRDTRVKIERFAKSKGVEKKPKVPFWDRVLRLLLAEVKTPEPEYLRLSKK